MKVDRNQKKPWSGPMCAQGRCATRLRYAPTITALLILNHFLALRYCPACPHDKKRPGPARSLYGPVSLVPPFTLVTASSVALDLGVVMSDKRGFWAKAVQAPSLLFAHHDTSSRSGRVARATDSQWRGWVNCHPTDCSRCINQG